MGAEVAGVTVRERERDREAVLPEQLWDRARLGAVEATGLLDTGPERVFEDLADLAARVTVSGRAFVTLVDERRSFWKACVGVDALDIADRQQPVADSFCYLLIGLGGAPLIVEDARRDPRTREHPALAPMNIGAWAGFPLLGPGGEVLGSFCVIDDRPRPWSPTDLITLETLARAVSAEIELRQSLADAQKALALSADLAHSLQQGLLPPSPPRIPGIEVAASYTPASRAGRSDIEVGGDFYDLFRTRGTSWGVVLGDVCGKGVQAAQVSSMARYTIRALATDNRAPADVLDHLNTAMLTQDSPRFLTAIYARFRPTPGGIAGTLALAGHPPALIRRADGTVHPAGTSGMLLGVFEPSRLRDVRFRLTPGDLLLLYTDGATEARARPGAGQGKRDVFDDSDLARTLAATAGMDATGTVDHINEALAARHGGWASDDTALLALRVPDLHRP
ncbi:GAF domain-containing SpoIIE family protein phosphatase [Streptomyces sp. Isolate_45]|uniref:PP2C family protein-serine/threonine phosphatase n=1 Tax=Streptomyces sp. Isolate_45 TaxID=2950111 RepID=UPI002481DB55|nr:GAF domain-containing SpoIIE family protein phosphatase [Streptomyces sp. Isolate_45]MDA5282753.1 SpoIIE family protein phosphatase [Streptomyces sp. Isolate_45]